jgi:hypothetical protein
VAAERDSPGLYCSGSSFFSKLSFGGGGGGLRFALAKKFHPAWYIGLVSGRKPTQVAPAFFVFSPVVFMVSRSSVRPFDESHTVLSDLDTARLERPHNGIDGSGVTAHGLTAEGFHPAYRRLINTRQLG